MNAVGIATVTPLEALPDTTALEAPLSLDSESRDWLDGLRAARPATREETVARLHALLLRGAHFEVARRRPTLPHLRGNELDDIATEAADDALVSILDEVRLGRSASRAWQGREVPLEPESWSLFSSTGLEPELEAEQHELVEAVQTAIADALTPHQRSVLVSLAVNGVPIDVVAERLGTTRGALYKTLHDARRKLRRHLAERGLALEMEER